LGIPTGLVVGLAAPAAFAVPAVDVAGATAGVAATCRGQPATIVGTPDQKDLAGTPGADIIVTGGARNVTADAGNDLVCVTTRTTFVDAGPDDDTVITADDGAIVTVRLGDGADIFSGGARPDQVRPGPGADQVATGDGDDSYGVEVSPTESTGDLVDLGPGNDFAVAGPDMGTTLEGGTGRNTLIPSLGFNPGQPRRWVFDNSVELATSDAGELLAWRNFTAFRFDMFEFDRQMVRFRGSDGDEEVSASSDASLGAGVDVESVDMGGGADRVRLFGVLGAVGGGSGRDRLDLTRFGDGRSGFPARDTWVHLGLERMRVEGRSAKIAGFEDLEVDGFIEVALHGNARANTLIVGQACWTRMEGRGGSDQLVARPRGRCGPRTAEFFEIPHRVDAIGNGGNDELRGRKTDDRLIGGPGQDFADGRFGSDYCEAETRDDCERGRGD
jgi:Ca2+-binding RTX toxin-like protein